MENINLFLVEEELCGVVIKYYEDSSGNLQITRKQVGDALGYENRATRSNMFRRNYNAIGGATDYNATIKDKNGIIKTRKLSLYNIEQLMVALTFTWSNMKHKLITHFCEKYNCDPIITNRYEVDFDEVLIKTFNNIFDIKSQKIISNYRLDWYIPKYNIIIECDENGHVDYNKEKETLRTEIINRELNNPKWIRFNPNEKYFNIGNVINEILISTISNDKSINKEYLHS